MHKHLLATVAGLVTSSFLVSCGGADNPASTTPSSTTSSSTTQDISSLSLLKTIEIADAARPEIIRTTDRVFVVCLVLSPSRTFRVNIYNGDMTAIVNSATLVSNDATYGDPTDIRVISDGAYLYAFYETLNGAQKKTYLFGAKYALDDNFTRAAYTGALAQSAGDTVAVAGDEKLDDPAPMLSGDDLTVMTRIKSTLAQSGETIYRFRKFDKSLQQKEYSPGVTTFDIDLSAYADGEARQSSIILENNYYYLTVQTAVGPSSIGNDNIIWSIPANLLIVKLDSNFGFVESRTVSAETGYTEGYVTGLRSDGKYFYVTYNHVKLGTEFSSVIKIFDKNWNAVVTEKYKSVASGGLRPSIEISTNQVIAGNDEEGAAKAVIYVFNKQ
ncbi:MAG: hypothetical protein HY886_09820 [Deltaproteobacteria bacterium]|nr:hypothetical protein [Deltaproteobacteria bacterium]